MKNNEYNEIIKVNWYKKLINAIVIILNNCTADIEPWNKIFYIFTAQTISLLRISIKAYSIVSLLYPLISLVNWRDDVWDSEWFKLYRNSLLLQPGAVSFSLFLFFFFVFLFFFSRQDNRSWKGGETRSGFNVPRIARSFHESNDRANHVYG